MRAMANVCVLGLFCVDLITRTERLPGWGESLRGQGFSLKPGGKGANQAVAAAYQGAAVSFISRLGDDAFQGIIPAFNAGPVVDTIGAGDAFNGALAAALAAGQSLPDAARRACVAAGLSVTKAGAAPSLPSKEMVDRHLPS